ncbi:MAG: cell division ATP-binding protein FtsE [Ruminococcaceae bacterium]|nr:cell division ATP-binding protein FtsE [Oscillospiraceae bacterium]
MIELKDVTKVYDDGTHALENVNLKIDDGEFVFIVGASGAGKSTLIKLLLREETVTSGKIIINGTDIASLTRKELPEFRRKLGVVFQDFRLIPSKNVYENIAFAMRVLGKPVKEIKRRVPTMLDLVDLSDKAKSMPVHLSGGEKQRTALARALINSPKIIIADEPTGNVDPEMSKDIMGLLLGISQTAGITVVVVTHEKSLVDTYNKRVITISDGKVVSDREGGYAL